MTNNQALIVANHCSILYGSKQISFGVANKFATNAKIQIALNAELDEIRKRGAERNETEEAIKIEIIDFLNSEFTGNFKEIDLAVIENLNYEEIEVFNQNNDSQFVRISDLLIVLQELNIIK